MGIDRDMRPFANESRAPDRIIPGGIIPTYVLKRMPKIERMVRVNHDIHIWFKQNVSRKTSPR